MKARTRGNLDDLSQIAWRATLETPGRRIAALHTVYRPRHRLPGRRIRYCLATVQVSFTVSHATGKFVVATDGRRFARHTLEPAPGCPTEGILPFAPPATAQVELF